MRSLIFTGGRHPDTQIFLSYITPYSFVVAADSGFDAALSAGITPDVIVGDMDSLKNIEALNLIEPNKVKKFSEDKDLSDTEIAFNYCVSSGSDDIVLIGGGGGRMDHFFALRKLFDRKNCPSSWIGEDTILVKVENKCIEIRGLDKEDCISIFPAGSIYHDCISEGFFWPIDNLNWEKGEYSLSNRSQSSNVRFYAKKGRFLVVLPLKEGLTFQNINEISE
ncbi:MAG TPA: thiamine diphosphokinase [Treponemataceae bacterium]|nr:thiamine diphosphokinase [Treponemataceae bacterium]